MQSGSKDTADERRASAANSADSRPSAIERQIAVTAGLDSRNSHRETNRGVADHSIRRQPRLLGFLLLVLPILIGLALLFFDTGLSWQKVVDAAQQVRLKLYDGITHNNFVQDNFSQTHSAQSNSSQKNAVQTNDPLPAAGSSSAANSSTVSSSAISSSTTNSSLTNKSRAGPKVAAAPTSTATVLSIPISEVSLRNRPELLEQLVQIYRSKLADNPNDPPVRAALNQLQERSLSELQGVILEGDYAVAAKSMAIVSRLFPEAADSVRYKYLAARLERMQSQEKEKPAANLGRSVPASAANTLKSALPEPVSKPIASAQSSSAAINSSPAVAKRPTENAPSSKPEIRAVSITPGTMIEDRFVPGDDGNAFMVEISYRNFDKISEDQSGVSLVARLGVPGDSTVLAEAPIEISGDRGTKNFVMATLMPGNAGEKYKLNFILNGEFLTSRTVRLSRQGY